MSGSVRPTREVGQRTGTANSVTYGWSSTYSSHRCSWWLVREAPPAPKSYIDAALLVAAEAEEPKNRIKPFFNFKFFVGDLQV